MPDLFASNESYGAATPLFGGHSESFPDPFDDMASMAMPTDIKDAHLWCERILFKSPTYRAAIGRAINYFITDLDVTGELADAEEKQRYKECLVDDFGILEHIRTVGLDYACYGSSLSSILLKTNRSLSCQKCGATFPLRSVYENPEFRYRFSNFEFHAKCPSCDYSGPFRRRDYEGTRIEDCVFKRWPVHEIDIQHDAFTGESRYLWNIPADYKAQIVRGDIHVIEHANWQVVEAVRLNRPFLFDRGEVYHMREAAFSGIDAKGWGISRVLANFGQAWYLQVLNRHNEAIALDYVIPFRLLTPSKSGSPGGGILESMGAGNARAQIEDMLRRRRRDPTRWNILPFPVDYQALGGEARQMAPHELIALGRDDLLNAADVPVQFYKGDLTAQTSPAALRLFESSWSHWPQNCNSMLRAHIAKIGRVLRWQPVRVKLKSVTIADDISRQQTQLQLAMSQDISKTTAFRPLGIDYAEEQRLRMRERQMANDLQEKAEMQAGGSQQVAQMAAAGGQPQQPGAPAAGGAAAGGGATPGPAQIFGGAQPDTPEDVMQEATSYANTLLGYDDIQKNTILRQLKQSKPLVHAQTKEIMAQMRRDARMQGGAAVMQQQFGKSGANIPHLGLFRLRKILHDSD